MVRDRCAESASVIIEKIELSDDFSELQILDTSFSNEKVAWECPLDNGIP